MMLDYIFLWEGSGWYADRQVTDDSAVYAYILNCENEEEPSAVAKRLHLGTPHYHDVIPDDENITVVDFTS